jgi:branched-chain amino acid transport system substrate-binding protein
MRSRLVPSVSIVALALLVPALAVLMPSLGVAQSKKPIVIGVMGDFTGPIAPYGTASFQGATLAAEEINAAGGIKGSPIQLKQYDERNDPVEGVTLAKRLGDEVLVVLMVSGSSPALSAGPVLDRAGVPFITTVAANPAVTESGWKFVNRLHLSDRDQVERVIQYAVEQDRFTKIAVLYDTSDYGIGGRDIALKALAKRNMQPATVDGWKQTDADFSSQIVKLKGSGAQGVIVWGTVEGAVRIVQQMRSLGLDKVQVYGGGGLVTQKYIDLGGKAVEGTIATWAYVDPNVPRARDLASKYETRFKRRMDVFVAQGYDALHVLAHGIAQGGDSVGDRPQIQKAIRAIKYQGAVGDVTFDDNGQNVRKIYIARVENGKFVPVK